VDVWAAGVCLYVWVWGSLPFQGDSIPDMFTAIKEKPLAFPDQPACDPDLKDLIAKASACHGLDPITCGVLEMGLSAAVGGKDNAACRAAGRCCAFLA